MEGLTTYTSYKETGSKWLGKIPSTWDVHNLRTLICPRNERNRPELPLLSVAREKGVFVRSLTDLKENHNVMPEDLSNYKVAKAGSLVINKMKAWQGSMGIAPCDGLVSPAYYVYDLSFANRMYAQMLFRSKPYVSHFAQASDGVRVGQWDLTISRMKQIPVVIPPPEEQAAIVCYLDYAKAQLDRAIRAKRKTIALLNEQKQAIIHRAITRGLDLSVPLKSSGIQWLGDIPAHWDIFPIKRVASTLNGFAFSSDSYVDSGIPLVRIGDLKSSGNVDIQGTVKLPEKFLSSHDFVKISKGDLVMAMTGATIGKVAMYQDDLPALLNQRVCAFRYKEGKIRPEYLHLLLLSRLYLEQVLISCYGGAQPNISDKTLSNFKMPVPTYDEQKAIVAYVSAKSEPLNITIFKFEREIQLLQEYQTRIISDVVTGKLDVRGAAKNLPEQTISEQSNDAGQIEEEEHEVAA